MLSPVTAITAGALAFALGGAFLIAQPFADHGAVPDAAAGVEPTWVTGTAEYSEECSRVGPTSSEDGVIHEVFDCLNEKWTADDARLTGSVRKSWSLDGYRTEAAGYRSVLANRWNMDTGNGTWDCRSVQLARGTGITAGTLEHDIITCVGDGAHEGLTAMVQVDWAVAGHPFEAIIFSGEVPAVPEASDLE